MKLIKDRKQKTCLCSFQLSIRSSLWNIKFLPLIQCCSSGYILTVCHKHSPGSSRRWCECQLPGEIPLHCFMTHKAFSWHFAAQIYSLARTHFCYCGLPNICSRKIFYNLLTVMVDLCFVEYIVLYGVQYLVFN